MKKRYIKIVFVFSCINIFITACNKPGDFDEKYVNNPNPYVNTTANTSQLLTNLLYRSSGRGSGNPVNGDLLTLGDKEPALFVQYIGEALYPTLGLYTSTFGEWSSYYTGPLMDLKFIINYNQDPKYKEIVAVHGSNNNQLATARIWRAYLFSLITDKWGDVPYSEANIVGLTTPRYDRQQDIYNDLFKELKEAVGQFDNGAAFKGDVLFNGDQSKWKKFGNSLRMILALRLSKVDPVKGKSEFQAAYTDPGGYIALNADNATFKYLDNLNYRNPWNNQAVESNAYGISDYFVNMLKNYNDPRLTKYAEPATGSTYTGVPYGLNPGHLATAIAAIGAYSKMGSSFTQRNSPGYFITASQMLLTKAEAGLRGWITGTSSKDDYENGIRASMELNGITTAPTVNAYIAGSNVAINVANLNEALTKVQTQKYIALFPNGMEAYSEWRRTNVPPLTPAQDALNASKQIPRRFGYPTNESILNAVNYNAAISTLGGDNSTDKRVWWDKQ